MSIESVSQSFISIVESLNNTHLSMEPAPPPLCGRESVLFVQTVRDENTIDTRQKQKNV